jgi:glycosyltransferase involved in cell wall biosynthesis
MQPFISVLTPTFNRRKFIPSIIECYKAQTYPKERMEWIILDDGESVKDLFDAIKDIPNIRYIHHPTKLLIGAKRNILNKEAKGDILIAMDDDDYYLPERVAHVVKRAKANPTIEVFGSSELYLYYTDIHEIYKFGPYGPNHATNGTMAWRKSYALSHTYDETVAFAEEKSYLNNYTTPIHQLDSLKVMLVISHNDNTFNKKQFRETPNHFVKKTSLKLPYFIKDAKTRKFFETA